MNNTFELNIGFRHPNISRAILFKSTSSACWECVSHKPTSNGYVGIRHKGKYRMLHRVIHEIYNDGTSLDKPLVLHSCDNKICCNPKHLRSGTQQENMDDMYRRNRGRKASGESHGISKLDRNKAIAIKDLLKADNLSQRAIANLFGVSQKTILNIKQGKVWK